MKCSSHLYEVGSHTSVKWKSKFLWSGSPYFCEVVAHVSVKWESTLLWSGSPYLCGVHIFLFHHISSESVRVLVRSFMMLYQLQISTSFICIMIKMSCLRKVSWRRKGFDKMLRQQLAVSWPLTHILNVPNIWSVAFSGVLSPGLHQTVSTLQEPDVPTVCVQMTGLRREPPAFIQ
jgi:hypothetical protein